MLQYKKLYMHLEAGLLIEASFVKPYEILRCSGRKVEIESCEMNTVLIEGTYYVLGQVEGELIELEEAM